MQGFAIALENIEQAHLGNFYMRDGRKMVDHLSPNLGSLTSRTLGGSYTTGRRHSSTSQTSTWTSTSQLSQ